MKTAVILFNLGGPDSKESIEPFLFNFFIDPNIIAAPNPVRWLIAKSISKKRSKAEAGESYSELGDRSPLLKNTAAQAAALESQLGDGFKVFVCMRYWHPMAEDVVREVKQYAPDQIVLLPLYPQFSTTTTWSSFGVWNKAAQAAGLDVPCSTICCYPLNEGFIKASAGNIKKCYAEAQKEGHEKPRVLFSAHGLPEKIIKKGDPYQWQCEQTAEKIAGVLELENDDWQICYQSRVGPLKWIGPSLDEALAQAAEDKKAVIVYPHAFTQEHVETLVELDIEYKEEADKLGVPGYYRAKTVSTHPAFVDGLTQLVKDHRARSGVFAEGFTRSCPAQFDRCCMSKIDSRETKKAA